MWTGDCQELLTDAALVESAARLPLPGTIVPMIARLRGTLLTKSPNQAIVECGGVGYDVAISVATFSALPAEGGEARLHI